MVNLDEPLIFTSLDRFNLRSFSRVSFYHRLMLFLSKTSAAVKYICIGRGSLLVDQREPAYLRLLLNKHRIHLVAVKSKASVAVWSGRRRWQHRERWRTSTVRQDADALSWKNAIPEWSHAHPVDNVRYTSSTWRCCALCQPISPQQSRSHKQITTWACTSGLWVQYTNMCFRQVSFLRFSC